MTELRVGKTAAKATDRVPHEVRAIVEDAAILGLIVIAATFADELAIQLLGEHLPPVIQGLLTASLYVMAGIYAIAVAATMKNLVKERLFAKAPAGSVEWLPTKTKRGVPVGARFQADQQQLSVLVVDDDRLASSAVTQVLRLDGRIGQITTANSPDAAIAKIQSGPEGEAPDVVLMDVNYAGIEKTGIDALGELHEVAPASKLLIMSVCREPATVRAALANDADGFIWKNESAVDFAEAVVGAAHHSFIASKSIARELIELA